MRVIILDSAAEVAHTAAEQVARLVQRRRKTGDAVVLGLATGSSPLGTYEILASRVREGTLDVRGVRCFALDEYVGLDCEHPESYHAVIHSTVTVPLGLNREDVRIPDGLAVDLNAACLEYEAAIAAAGGIDLQLLGIGQNGHIGFNEPTSSLASRTRPTTLTPQTRKDNARFFSSLEEVPLHAVTQGIGTILDAGELLLVAQGESKAEAIAAMIEGPVSSVCPASALQLHPRATVMIDRAAASQLDLADFYEHIERNRRTEQ